MPPFGLVLLATRDHIFSRSKKVGAARRRLVRHETFLAAKGRHARLRGKKLARLFGGRPAADYFFQKFAGPFPSRENLTCRRSPKFFLLGPDCRLQGGAPALQEKLARVGGVWSSMGHFSAKSLPAPAPPREHLACRRSPKFFLVAWLAPPEPRPGTPGQVGATRRRQVVQS
jgi:hypothetical protein